MLLAHSPEAREEYWDIIAVHSDLSWELAGKSACNDELAAILLDEVGLMDCGPGCIPARTSATASLVWGLAAAVCLIAGTLFSAWTWQRADTRLAPVAARPPAMEKQNQVAPVLGRLMPVAAETRWSLGRPGAREQGTETVHFGDTIWLSEGAAELRLLSDTAVQLEAPLVVQAVSLDRFRVLSGRIKVDVPKGSEGFTVETASAEIVDLGTVFSVEVTSCNTDLVVFQGQVDLKAVGRDSNGQAVAGATRRFYTGEAVRVSRDGTLSRIVNVYQATRPSAGGGVASDPIITSVKDNISRGDVWKYYEIVAGGMTEDARAFVDRRHEWNGATADGMPPYLVAGDYVKTFNDDKVTDDLKIDVTLNHPATLYVLLDERVTPPSWLVERFVNTGDEIGVDEAWHDPLNFTPGLEDFAQKGPGQSIERTHSIWRLDVPDGGVVTLGANGRLPGDKWRGTRAGVNMYGIVAVPLGGHDPQQTSMRGN